MVHVIQQAVSKPVWHVPLLCVQWKTPEDGQRNCPKHVEFYSKNKLEKLVHLVGFIIRVHFCNSAEIKIADFIFPVITARVTTADMTYVSTQHYMPSFYYTNCLTRTTNAKVFKSTWTRPVKHVTQTEATKTQIMFPPYIFSFLPQV